MVPQGYYSPRFAARLDQQHVKKLKTRFLRYRKRVENYNKKVDLVDRITPNFMEFLVNNVSQIPGGKGSQLPAVQEHFIQENTILVGGATVPKIQTKNYACHWFQRMLVRSSKPTLETCTGKRDSHPA
jgi:hypothetical protein